MKTLLKIFLLICILYFGISTVKSEFEGYEVGVISSFGYFGHLFLFLLTIISFFIEKLRDKTNKKVYHYPFTLLSLVFCSLVIFKILERTNIETKETILKVSNTPKANSVINFEFKTGNDFRLTENNKLGQVIYFGSYSKLKDTIKIISSNYDGLTKKLPEWGVIRNDTIYWDKFDTMLVDKN